MLVEMHIIQNHSPANLNRDDLGAPKTAMFGGTLRARISSQCIKRSIRRSSLFGESLEGCLGTRTVSFPEIVGEELKSSDIPEKDHSAIIAACTGIATEKKGAEKKDRPGDDRPRTDQLIFLGAGEANQFVKILDQLRSSMAEDYRKFLKAPGKPDASKGPKGKKADEPGDKFWAALKEAFSHNSVDIALFGRMTTSRAFEDVEAAMQVAHAISTNQVVPEVDYFTAVDDVPGRAGAAYLEEGQFNSATFYKYFSLDWDSLVRNLHGKKDPKPQELNAAVDLAGKAFGAFIRAAACTVPSGKRNSFGNSNLPDAILIEVKQRSIPTNYANAFLVPATCSSDAGGTHDMVAQSIGMLDHYVATVVKCYEIESKRWWFSTRDDREAPFSSAERVDTLSRLIGSALKELGGR